MLFYKLSPIFFGLFTLLGFGQNATVATGGNASNTAGKVSFSIGQVLYQTEVSNSNSVQQGVQQPFEISALKVLSNESSNFQISIYPNPTSQLLTLDIRDAHLADFQCQLFDVNGKPLSTENPVNQQQTSISLDTFPSGVYFVIIKNHHHHIQTFKIIKK